jgi:GMP synthase (glutamine-hydrolysing)
VHRETLRGFRAAPTTTAVESAVRARYHKCDVATLLVIKTGTSLPTLVERRKDYDTWITTGTGMAAADVRVVSVYKDEPLPDARSVQGVVVSGSSAMVTDREGWSERTAEWLREAVQCEVPVLGICYGHQLLAHALGGEVEYNPQGRNIGTIEVELNADAKNDRLFGVFARGSLCVSVSHRQCVTKLPPGATLLARSTRDPHQAFRYGSCAWGVQFHPEFDAGITRVYIETRRADLVKEGFDVEALLNETVESVDGTIVLRRFAEVVRRRL